MPALPSPRSCAAALLALTSLFSASALAGIPEEAQALFDQGLAAMEARRFEEACPLIEKSYVLAQLPGALFTLAECEAMRGRAAAAVTRYDEYLALYPTLPPAKKAKQHDRDKLARAARAALTPKVAELTLVLPPGAPKGTQLMRDGAPIAESALGTPIIVDPGEHIIKARAPDSTETETRVKVAAGEKRGIAVEVRIANVSPAPAAASGPAPDAPQSAPGANKALIISGGALAGAAAITGAVFAGLYAAKGGTASTLYDEVKAQGCPPASTNPTGKCGELKSALESQATFGSVAVGSFVTAGAVGVATLIYGLAAGSSPKPASSSFWVAPIAGQQGGGLTVGGSF